MRLVDNSEYNNYLIELISLGYGNCPTHALPLNYKLKISEFDFNFCARRIESYKYKCTQYYLDDFFNKFLLFYRDKCEDILNKHCKS